MDIELLKRKFAKMGARLTVREGSGRYTVDVDGDRFILEQGEAPIDFQVIHLDAPDRHLVLMARRSTHEIEKYLCGHDERHWFVAAVPEGPGARADRLRSGVSTVGDAKQALKPGPVVEAERRRKVKRKHRHKRRNKAFLRQGEWFFLPRPKLEVSQDHILKGEPLSRGLGSKPHRVEELHRVGGETVYVSHRYPQGLSADAHQRLLKDDPTARYWRWETRVRDPQVFARGRVSHPDHATIRLDCWHLVVMNEEPRAKHAPKVVFLD